MSLATISGVTFNVTSMLAYGDEDARNNNKTKQARSFHRLDQVLNLARNRDYVCLQETKFRAKEKLYFKVHLPHHKVFYNNNPKNGSGSKNSFKAGTVIILHPRVLDLAEVTNARPIVGHEGYIQTVELREKSRNTPLTVRITCCYFESSENVASRQLSQMEALNSLPKSDLEYWCGDFNFVENKEDANRDAVFENTPVSLRARWGEILTTRNMKEIPQGLHTFWHLEEDLNKTRSSRIDRFYTSLPEALWELLGPVSTAVIKRNPGQNSLHTHFPVYLDFAVKQTPKGFSRPLPKFVFDADFKREFEELWNTLENPSLQDWKYWVRKKAKERFHKNKEKVDELGKLQVGLKLLQSFLSHPIPTEKCKNLCALIPDFEAGRSWLADEPPVKDLQKFLKSLYEGAEPDARDEGDVQDAWALEEKKIEKAKGYNFLKETKRYIPSTRKRLRMLRRSESEPPTADQKSLKEIIGGYYGETVWKKRVMSREDLRLRKEWLENYTNRIATTPRRVEGHNLYRAIIEARSTSTGPDGIPIEAYKLLVDIVVPLLLDKARDLEEEHFEPGDFNESMLTLIPKSNSGLIVDTRPISINNFDNRMIAKALVYCISDSVDEFIGDEQQLFIRGRQMSRHILDLNKLYYTAVNDEEQFYILFMDTAKAFDSIDHDFIFEVLEKQGFPEWFVVTVKNLMREVITYPSILTEKSLRIRVTRGVKQGCPLSPLLFILVYDVLIRALQDSELQLKVKAAADDVALASSSFLDLLSATKVVEDYRRISGLGLNQNKTVVLSSLPPCASEEEQIKNSPWPEMKMVAEQKYLGIVFGREMTWEDMYEPVMQKAEERGVNLKKVLTSLQLHKKVALFNTYIASLFSFVTKFFVAPNSILKRYRELVRDLVIPYGGKAFSYALLLSKSPLIGLKQPLRDLWAMNIKELTLQRDFNLIQSGADVEQWIWSKSMTIKEHIDFASAEFLLAYSSWDRVSKPKFSAKEIYHQAISNGYLTCTGVGKKISKFVPNRDDCRNIDKGLSNLAPHVPKGIPDFIRSHQFQTILNCLSTTARKKGIRDCRLRNGEQQCFLCEDGPDSVSHIYGDCITKEGLVQLEAVAELEGLSSLSSLSGKSFLPYSQSPGKHEGKLAGALLCFNWATWNTIQKIRESGFDKEQAVSLIVSTTMSLSKHWEGKSSAYGSAGSRTAEQKERAQIYAKDIISKIPEESVIAFTDGSAIPNPGHTGAGAQVCIGAESFSLLAPLGKANNNIGELWAIGMTLSFLSEKNVNRNVYILSDSKYSIGALMGSKKNKGTERLTLEIRKKIKAFPNKVRILWVPGHVGLEGIPNERADKLADQASKERLPNRHWETLAHFEYSVV